MNLRIPLIVFAVASVIGVMAVTTIAAMSMQKAYSIEATEHWCFGQGQECFSGHGAQDKCNAPREAELKKQRENSDIGFGATAPCVKQD